MKVAVEVKDRAEGGALKAGLEDPTVKAFVLVMGTLRALPSDRARKRVLEFVTDRLDEESQTP
jgi:hypothetical protein